VRASRSGIRYSHIQVGDRRRSTKSKAALLVAIEQTDAEVKRLKGEPQRLNDVALVHQISLAEQARRMAVFEAVLRRASSVPWEDIARSLDLSVSEAKSRYIR